MYIIQSRQSLGEVVEWEALGTFVSIDLSELVCPWKRCGTRGAQGLTALLEVGWGSSPLRLSCLCS